MWTKPLSLVAIYVAATVLGCKREERQFRAEAPMADVAAAVPMSNIVPGLPAATQPAADWPGPTRSDYEANAFATGEGQRLYEQFNCVGCHAHGGGDIGPPLKDDKRIYGHEPRQIYLSIVQGRPNGMPAFGTRLNESQAWQLTAYVRSLSGLTSPDAAPGRTDHMAVGIPPNSMPTPKPINSSTPQSVGTPLSQ